MALCINGDRSVVYNCHIEGHQDTLYYHTSHQFYRNCVISGTIDFIFGMGDAVIQNSLIVVRKPMDNQLNTITADGRQLERGSNGLVLQNCKIVADKELVPTRFKIASYLGRPWKEHALTVVMQTEIGDFIRPEGWVHGALLIPTTSTTLLVSTMSLKIVVLGRQLIKGIRNSRILKF